MQLLIEQNANVNSTTKTKSSPLRAACYDGHLEVVKYLVEHNADIELSNRYGHTCLMIAAFKGNFKICEYLIQMGADVNKRSIKGNTAMHDCAETGSTEIMSLLIKNKARMMEDAYHITPLLTAALNGTESILHLLINENKCLFTEIERINAMELMGSTLVDKKRDLSNGIKYWRMGFLRREENKKRILLATISNNGKDKVSEEDNSETIEIYQKKLAKPNAAYNYSVEFNSLNELDQIAANVDEVRMQSLLIRERILGQTHSDTTYYIRFRGAVYADSGDFEMCIKLWLYALDKQQSSLDPLSPSTQSSLFSFAELFSYMMSNKADLVVFEEIFAVFKRALFELKSAILILPNKKVGQNKYQFYKMKLLQRINGNELREDCLEDELIRGVVDNLELNDFISNNNNVNNLNANEQQLMKNIINNVDVDNLANSNQTKNGNNDNLELNKPKDELDSINFHRILIILQIFIGLLCRLKPIMTDNQSYRLKKSIYQLVRLNPRGNHGITILHHACFKDESCQLIKFPICEMPIYDIIQLLIECGADPNALDNDGCTPLHYAVQFPEIIKLLIDNNAHIDIKNKEGETPLDNLINNPKFLNENRIYPMKHLTLQCLCAQTITKNNLNYKNFLSKQVCDFVKIH